MNYQGAIEMLKRGDNSKVTLQLFLISIVWADQEEYRSVTGITPGKK